MKQITTTCTSLAACFTFALILLAPGRSIAQPFPLDEVAELAAGITHTCALTSDGAVKCWGDNARGQLGDGTTTQRFTAVNVTGLDDGVLAIRAGDQHTCALTSSNGVRCWGRNSEGQLGDGGTTDKWVPTDVVGLASGVFALSAGSGHTCAVTVAGAAKCWGLNSAGELGDGTTTRRLVPTDVMGLGSGVEDVSAGYEHTCALVSGGGVKCWGYGADGRLGDGSGAQRLTAVDVVGLTSGVQAIATRGGHSCALTDTGGVQCWGYNAFGQLGDGSTSNRLVPVDVFGLSSGVQAISTFGDHTCGLTDLGAAKCWGHNSFGQLGNAGNAHSAAPVDVTALGSGVARIEGGLYHSCAVTTTGFAHCWGSNSSGQLGDGTANDSSVPVAVLATDDGSRRVASLTPAGDAASLAPQSDASGRYVVLQSAASNLIGSDQNGGSDIYVVDRETGNAVRASVNDDESEAGGGAVAPSISADGALVSFVAPDAAVTKVLGESSAKARERIKAGTTSVFLRNLITGSTQRIGLTQPPAGNAKPRLAPNGKAIVYTAINTDPQAGVVGQANIYRVALQTSGGEVVPKTPECVSCQSRSAVGVAAGSVDGPSDNAAVSANARYIAYETKSVNAIAGAPSPCPNVQILLRDMVLGLVQRISPPPNIAGVNCGTTGSTNPSLDWTGNTIVFSSDAALKPGQLPGVKNVFSGAGGGIEHLTPAFDGSAPDGVSDQATISGDGSTVVFASQATNLGGGVDTNGVQDLFAITRATTGGSLCGGRSCAGRARRLARGTDGSQANADADRPAVNYNATVLMFDSAASNLVGGDGNGQVDVFERAIPANIDRVFGTGFE